MIVSILGILSGIYCLLFMRWYLKRHDDLSQGHLFRIKVGQIATVGVIIFFVIKLLMEI